MSCRQVWTLAFATAVAVLCIQSSAFAYSQAMGAYSNLVSEHRTPAPLVPTTLPSALGSFEDNGTNGAKYGTQGKGYYLLFQHVTKRPIVDANLLVINAGKTSLSKQKRKLRKLYRARKTNVRGHPALAFKRKKGQGKLLAWIEDGSLYEVGTGTPRKVPDGDLMTTANGLDHLLGALTGENVGDGSRGESVGMLVAERHVFIWLYWTAPCVVAADPEAPSQVTTSTTLVAPLTAGSFTVGPTAIMTDRPGQDEPKSWTVSASGMASVAGAQVTAQASGDTVGSHCAIGPLGIAAQPIAEPHFG